MIGRVYFFGEYTHNAIPSTKCTSPKRKEKRKKAKTLAPRPLPAQVSPHNKSRKTFLKPAPPSPALSAIWRKKRVGGGGKGIFSLLSPFLSQNLNIPLIPSSFLLPSSAQRVKYGTWGKRENENEKVFFFTSAPIFPYFRRRRRRRRGKGKLPLVTQPTFACLALIKKRKKGGREKVWTTEFPLLCFLFLFFRPGKRSE